jgi:hypothetical protein
MTGHEKWLRSKFLWPYIQAIIPDKKWFAGGTVWEIRDVIKWKRMEKMGTMGISGFVIVDDPDEFIIEHGSPGEVYINKGKLSFKHVHDAIRFMENMLKMEILPLPKLEMGFPPLTVEPIKKEYMHPSFD